VSKQLKVTQVRSAIGRDTNQKETLRSLRIRRLNRPVVHDDTPGIRGMIASIKHLLRVEEIEG
jgi:large subunit ribosomal protein L30